MHALSLLLALIASIAAGSALGVTIPRPEASASRTPSGLVLAGGCHADTRTHFVPEFGRAVPHGHRRDCTPVAAEAPRRAVDCHREPREHVVPGRGRVYHRHVGPDCAIRVIRRSSSGSPD